MAYRFAGSERGPFEKCDKCGDPVRMRGVCVTRSIWSIEERSRTARAILGERDRKMIKHLGLDQPKMLALTAALGSSRISRD